MDSPPKRLLQEGDVGDLPKWRVGVRVWGSSPRSPTQPQETSSRRRGDGPVWLMISLSVGVRTVDYSDSASTPRIIINHVPTCTLGWDRLLYSPLQTVPWRPLSKERESFLCRLPYWEFGNLPLPRPTLRISTTVVERYFDFHFSVPSLYLPWRYSNTMITRDKGTFERIETWSTVHSIVFRNDKQ